MTAAVATPLVEVRGLSKRFGQFLALDSLEVYLGPGAHSQSWPAPGELGKAGAAR